MRILTFLLFTALFITACKKDPEGTVNPPDPVDSSSFAVPKTEDIVLYEVNIRALSATGDFQGVIDRLDEIRALGANVIWLMPIHPVGQINSVNSPYCVQNYKEVNPEFGTLQHFQELVRQAHNLDIAVIIDWVANHTSWDNPWITNKDWYTQDGLGNIIHPSGTNWQDVADLNFGNAPMRLSMIEAMEYWVNVADIDGFRCDAADFVPFDFWQQAITALTNDLDKQLILLAEGARNDHFTAGFQMNYAWDFYNKLKGVFTQNQSAADLFTVNVNEYKNIPPGKHKLRFTTNHDESAWDATPVVLFNGKQGAMAASVMAICLKGIPLIYGSQEVGVSQTVPFFEHTTIDWSQNPDMLAEYKKILSLYNSSETVRYDSAIELKTYIHKDILAFQRINQQEKVIVLVNARNRVVTFTVPPELANTSWKNAFDDVQVILPASFEFQPYQYRVLKNF
ncbi:MAG TPA: alpha-amylase family glycosyl hydrolase [Bacteroidales bacterium]|nr:alpha-amylase family glycosyl hydrolase [Bacteroidales bacterium]HNS46787.1 alpha-amylase family glycosyl hydrolase [Bacteroidales bacterium]